MFVEGDLEITNELLSAAEFNYLRFTIYDLREKKWQKI